MRNLKVRRNESQWRELFTEHESSGLSAAQFCRLRGIDPKYFSLRKQQLKAVSSKFIEMKPESTQLASDAPSSLSASSCRLRVIDVDVTGMDAVSLARLIDGLVK